MHWNGLLSDELQHLIQSGKYLSGRFTIEVPGVLFPDECQPGEPGFHTFIHEHVHYVQDLSTYFGLQRFVWYLRVLAEVQQIAIQVPALLLPIGNEDNAKQANRGEADFRHHVSAIEESLGWLRLLNGFKSFGSAKIRFKEICGIEVKSVMAPLGGSPYSFPEVLVHGVSANGRTFSYALGAIAIQEGMAALAEKLMGGNPSELDYFPYHIALDAIRYELPEISDAAALVILDSALNTDFPGHCLIKLCKILVQKMWRGDLADLHQICWDWQLQHANGYAFAFKDLQGVAAEVAPLHHHGGTSFRWVVDAFDKANCARYEDPARYTRPYYQKRPVSEVLQLLQDVAPAIVVDKTQTARTLQAGSNLAADSAMFFSGLRSILQGVCSTQPIPCAVEPWCDLDMKDANCLSTPWVRADELPRTCPTGVAAACVGLQHRPVVRVAR